MAVFVGICVIWRRSALSEFGFAIHSKSNKKNTEISETICQTLIKNIVYLFLEFQGMKSLIFLDFRVRQKLLAFS
mgnify:CR=1 FL=1